MPLCLFVLFLLAACSAGPRNFENENDRLRREVMTLQERLKQSRAENRRLAAALEAASEQPVGVPEGMTVPRLAEVSIEMRSGGIDTDGDGKDDAVRLYIDTLDQQGRLLPVIADAAVTITHTPAGESAVTLATAQMGPKAFDQAYRSGFTGTHYTLEIPLTTMPPEGAEAVTAHVRLTDRVHGGSVETKADVRVHRD